jgi:hypothetical protein
VVLDGSSATGVLAERVGGRFLAVEALLGRLASGPESFVVDPSAAGLDWSVENQVRGVPNRARVKCFSPKEDALLVWFYKRSALSWSRERFSYGGVLLDAKEVSPSTIDGWIRYQVGGFSPEERPPGMRRSFPFDLPA